MFFFCNQRRSAGRNDGSPQEEEIRVNRVRRLIRRPIKRSPTRKAKPTSPIPHGLSVLVIKFLQRSEENEERQSSAYQGELMQVIAPLQLQAFQKPCEAKH
jgi:hypothetical protein